MKMLRLYRQEQFMGKVVRRVPLAGMRGGWRGGSELSKVL